MHIQICIFNANYGCVFLVGVRLFMFETIKKNLSQIQEEIAPYRPKIIAVTKYFDENAIEAAYDAGLKDFGESRAVEAVQKIKNLPENVRENSKFHFIGHLQSNKVKKVIEVFDYIHSVDSIKLAEVISEEAQARGKVQNILLQLNNANEIQKFGFSKQDLLDNFGEIKKLKGINISGLMNMAPLGADNEELKELFGDVIKTKELLENQFGYELKEVSMGMSQDYKVAAQQGATMLRIGRKLFS